MRDDAVLHRALPLGRGLGQDELLGYCLETGTAAELRLALTIILTLTDTGFAVLTLLTARIHEVLS